MSPHERELKSLACASIRWSLHILTETFNSTQSHIPTKANEQLTDAFVLLFEAGECIRRSMKGDEDEGV